MRKIQRQYFDIKKDNYAEIPYELRLCKQWVVWRLEQRGNKQTKVPYQPNGYHAQSNNANTWHTFDDVVNAARTNNYDGIGFMFSKDDDYIGIDIDHCLKNGAFNEVACDVLSTLNSYTEISPSGMGIHIIVRASINQGRKIPALGLEIYPHGRYFTFTGNRINSLGVEERKDELIGIIEKYFYERDKKISVPKRHPSHQIPIKSTISNKELWNKMFNSRNGSIIKALFDGHLVNNDWSSADLALCNHLAFWTDKNAYHMDSMFRESGLMRDKWDEARGELKYNEMTIYKAIEDTKTSISDYQNTSNLASNLKSNSTTEKGEISTWWVTNANGTKTLLHKVMAEEVLNEFCIVRFPTPHSDLYFYNKQKGVYEQDSSGRQVSAIIRSKDDLRNSQVKEVQEYIQDMSPVVCNVNVNYIALKNGLLNLKTFQLESFNPNVFLIQKISANYNKNAHDDFVQQTLEKVTKGYAPSIQNIHEMFACVLYPEILVPKMFYLYGRTAHNGKSSVLTMIYETFDKNGGNISAVSPQKLASNTFAGASIYGKLANMVDDQPDQLIEDSGTLKTIITGGRVEIERKGKDSETVKMSTVCITASNYYPNFKENGKQINRRLHIIPFEYDFSNDPNLMSDSESMQRIASETAREYVLKLAVEALKQMLVNPKADKLTHNEKSIEAGESFAEQNDPLSDYFFEYDIDYFEEMPGQRVLQEYEEWCKTNRTQPLDLKKFKEAVCNRYNMEWKTKSIKIKSKWKSVKGFKIKK
ncbi:phage/plasmid primase, P4 family [Lysinibacillus sp. NPDC048646]|uniref:phage/plasmid primase, P4 family n=1 Tax=Lysinibacillus sp. NPDC048646 TaxID=3390574 RepID=UPI003CFD071C